MMKRSRIHVRTPRPHSLRVGLIGMPVLNDVAQHVDFDGSITPAEIEKISVF